MLSVDINKLLSAFSLALDIAENQTLEHAQRTAYIALQIAKQFKLLSTEIEDIYIAALLHDIGFTHSKAEAHLDSNQLVSHCYKGKEIVRDLPFISDIVGEYIVWHHANWDGSGAFSRSGNDIPLGAQIIYLADRLDLNLRELTSIYDNRSKVLDFVQSNSGTLFNPEVVDCFLAVQQREKFWLDYNTQGIDEITDAFFDYRVKLDLANIELVANAFAKIIDNKSPFTHNHSRGVADLAAKLGKHCGLDSETVQKLKISGLLHDLGKLSVPNEILDKPGKLTPHEYRIMKGHAYYTKRILSKISGLEDIANWAGNHHETVDGQGYPECIEGQYLTVPERIMTICDIYQALTEERPYREKIISRAKAFEILDDLADRNKICQELLLSFKKVI